MVTLRAEMETTTTTLLLIHVHWSMRTMKYGLCLHSLMTAYGLNAVLDDETMTMYSR